jgi:hypothetical protein
LRLYYWALLLVHRSVLLGIAPAVASVLLGTSLELPIWVIPLHVFNIGCVIHVQDPFFNVNSTVMSIW